MAYCGRSIVRSTHRTAYVMEINSLGLIDCSKSVFDGML